MHLQLASNFTGISVTTELNETRKVYTFNSAFKAANELKTTGMEQTFVSLHEVTRAI